MPDKRYTAEQIVAKLREAEQLQAQGATIPAVCKKLGVAEQTFYRWRTKYGALKEDEAQRLKALEQENARLKRIVAEQALDISMLRVCSGETSEPGPAARRGGLSGPPASRVRASGLQGGARSSLDASLRGGAGRLREPAGQVDTRSCRGAPTVAVSPRPRAGRRGLGGERKESTGSGS